MFTEHEIDTMIEIPGVHEAVVELKRDFCKNEAPYLEVTDHDFFSLVMMTPTVGIALANGSISLFEEIALNKKARKLSKGGYFMKKDPVVYAMKFLIKDLDKWEDKFYALLKTAIRQSFDIQVLEKGSFDEDDIVSYEAYKKEVLSAPYILIRFISSFFLENDEDIINIKRSIGKNEYLRMLVIGEKLGLDKVPVFRMFCKTFHQKA